MKIILGVGWLGQKKCFQNPKFCFLKIRWGNKKMSQEKNFRIRKKFFTKKYQKKSLDTK